MKNKPLIFILAIVAFFQIALLSVTFSAMGGPLAQGNPTEQQQTIDAIVNQLFTQTAQAQQTAAIKQTAVASQFTAAAQMRGTVNQARTATTAFQNTVNARFHELQTATVAPFATATAQARAATIQAYTATAAFAITQTAAFHEAASATTGAQVATLSTQFKQRIDPKGVPQLYVPAGCFSMGSDPTKDKDALFNEQPQHEVCLADGYWIDQYEVTNAAYQKFMDDHGYTNREYWSDEGWQWVQNNQIIGPKNFDGFTDPQQPRVGISWYEAEAYTHWRGGRLPTEAEWEFAARGPRSPIYPWSDAWDAAKANVAAAVGHTAPVGSFPDGKSWVGAQDMAGNVWEWVADRYDENYYKQHVKDNPKGPASGNQRVIRGGAWGYFRQFARAATREKNSPDIRPYNVGVRVAAAG